MGQFIPITKLGKNQPVLTTHWELTGATDDASIKDPT